MFARRWMVLALVAAAACGGRERAGTLSDDEGVGLVPDRPANAIISLSPAFTELLFAIGAGDLVVGRTEWCDYPPAALDVPSVGDGLAPNAELILARRPDLVLFYLSAGNAGALGHVRAAGIAAASYRIDRLDDVPRIARIFGRITGREDGAQRVAGPFEHALDSARSALPLPRQRVAIVVWDNPPIVIGAGSFVSELVQLAGAANVFDDITLPSAQTSIETIAARNPDALLLLGGEAPAAFAGRPEWRAVRAVRERRFVRVDGSAFSRPTPRALDAVRAMRDALSEVR